MPRVMAAAGTVTATATMAAATTATTIAITTGGEAFRRQMDRRGSGDLYDRQSRPGGETSVEHRDHDQSEGGRRKQSADHGDREGALHLRTRAETKSQRQQSADRRERRHQNRPQPFRPGADERLMNRGAPASPAIGRIHQQDSVAHDD